MTKIIPGQVPEVPAGSTHVSSWTIELPYYGETDDAWLFGAVHPACPVEALHVRKAVMPVRPACLIFTLVGLPFVPRGVQADKTHEVVNVTREVFPCRYVPLHRASDELPPG